MLTAMTLALTLANPVGVKNIDAAMKSAGRVWETEGSPKEL